MIPDFKYLVHLMVANRNAVVIDWTPEAARQRAYFYDPHGGWENASIEIITRVRATRIERILAIERQTETGI
jgi:hypothetical protein